MKRRERCSAAVAIALCAFYSAPHLIADCPSPDSRFIGNLGGQSTIQWDFDDPAAEMTYFFVEDPSINEGAIRDPHLLREVIAFPLGGSLRETLFFADIGAGGLGTNGCPSAGMQGVFLFSDRRGTTCVAATGTISGEGEPPGWNFDVAAIQSSLPSEFGFGTVLTSSPIPVRAHNACLLPGDELKVGIVWEAPPCFSDAPLPSLSVSHFTVYEIDPVSGTRVALVDEDGSVTDTRALVRLAAPAGITLIAHVQVEATFANSGGRGTKGGVSELNFNPPSDPPGEFCGSAVQPVQIDVKPGNDTNVINLSSAGVIPVAILSSAVVDATLLDPASILLAGASVRMVGKSGRFLCREQDVNKDGLTDLVCDIETAQFLIQTGASAAVLEAMLSDGRRIRGEDTVTIVPE